MAASPRINCASLGFWPLLQSRTFCSRLLCHLHRWWKSCLRSEDQELFQERLSEHQIQDNRVDHARTIYAENASLGRRPRFVAATTSSIKTLVPASKPHRGTKSAGIYIYIYYIIYILYIYILYYILYICKNVKTWTSSNVGTERLSSLHPQVTTCDHNWHGNGTEHWIKFVDKKRVYLAIAKTDAYESASERPAVPDLQFIVLANDPVRDCKLGERSKKTCHVRLSD